MTDTAHLLIERQLSTATAPRQTKAALLRGHLAKPDGVSMAKMMHLTGWQALTLRAALTALRRTGVILSRLREGGDTIYAIDLPGPVPASDSGGGQGAEANDAKPGIEANAPAISDPGKGAA